MSPLSDPEVQRRLGELEHWRLHEGPAITRELKFDDFSAAVEFVNRIAALAEAANHHPDILIHGWNRVLLTLSTHSEGALTDADFALAAQIDAVA